MDPRKAVTQRDRLGETSKSLEVKEAIWRRSAWALGRGGRSDRRAEEGVDELRSWGCWVCVGGSFGGVGFGIEGELGFARPSLAGDCTI